MSLERPHSALTSGTAWRLAEGLVTALFWVSAANLAIVFFVQGGYEFNIGFFHVHARYLTNSLLLCLVLAVAKSLLTGRRQETGAIARLRSPLLLFLSAVLIYYSFGGRNLGTGDTLPARYLPFSIVREGNFDLDEFSFLYQDEFRYFLTRSNGHVVSSYPPWAGLLATPVYLMPVLMGVPPQSPLVEDLEKRAAVLMTAFSVLIFYFVLRRLTREPIAWLVTVVYAFGTSSFSTSSQRLWQHGPSQLFLVLTIYCLVRGLKESRFSVYAGIFLGTAVIIRPLNVLIALPIAAYMLHQHRDRFFRFLLACAPPLLLLAAYNFYYFGSPFSTGFGNPVVGTSGKLLFRFDTPLHEGLLGVLVSPARGLFIYSPIFLVSFVSMILVWRQTGHLLLKYLSLAPILLILLISKWWSWWGGWCYGPRLLADITPILCLFLVPFFEQFGRKALLKYAIAGLAVVSISMHTLGAYNDIRWDENHRPETDPDQLWSWVDSPPVYNGKQLFENATQKAGYKFLVLKGFILATPTSLEAPQKLAATYSAVDLAPRLTLSPSGTLRIHVNAHNVGEATWLVNPEGDHGAVRLGWRWWRVNQREPVKEGRWWLPYDVYPGQWVEFQANIHPPPEPGEYILEIGMVREPMMWFSSPGVRPLRTSVHIIMPRKDS
jgi:hypothetical protein